MEDEKQDLIEKLREFIEIMTNDGTSAAAASDGSQEPHVELIDFDGLIESLKKVGKVIDAWERNQRQLELARQWFGNRIRALVKAEGVLLRKSPGAINDISDQASLTDLIHKYEDALTRLKNGNPRKQPALKSSSSFQPKEYFQYKS